MSELARRGFASRLGIAALNLLAPGLGLLRVQRPRWAIALLLAPSALLLAVVAVFIVLPELSFLGWVLVMAAMLVGVLAIYIAAIAMSWRHSALVALGRPWWSRWYGICAALLVAVLGNSILPDVARGYYRNFYIPSEAMMPTLLVNDGLVASMRSVSVLQRGDVILFAVGDRIYIKRIAALPGDRIAMRDGLVVLNGQAIVQRYVRTDSVEDSNSGNRARRLTEQFPGEASSHEIYDSGYSSGDDMAEMTVPAGHVFVLGDNRDHSADSRFPRSLHGVELLPIADIRGRALFYTWGPSNRLGERINP